MSNIHPVAGYILVKPQLKEKTTASGIVLTQTHEDKPQQGTVLSIGAATYNDGREVTSPVSVGDVVIYREWGGKEYKDGDTDLLILKFDDIMAVIK
jgi:chaperonin GroES